VDRPDLEASASPPLPRKTPQVDLPSETEVVRMRIRLADLAYRDVETHT
jgi:hypothetical protein